MEKRIWGLRVDQSKQLKGLERENLRLKRIVAGLALDLSILNKKRWARGTSKPGPLARSRGGRHHSAPDVQASSLSGDRPDPLISPYRTVRSCPEGEGRAKAQGLRILRTPEPAVKVPVRWRVVVGGRWYIDIPARRTQVFGSEVPRAAPKHFVFTTFRSLRVS